MFLFFFCGFLPWISVILFTRNSTPWLLEVTDTQLSFVKGEALLNLLKSKEDIDSSPDSSFFCFFPIYGLKKPEKPENGSSDEGKSRETRMTSIRTWWAGNEEIKFRAGPCCLGLSSPTFAPKHHYTSSIFSLFPLATLLDFLVSESARVGHPIVHNGCENARDLNKTEKYGNKKGINPIHIISIFLHIIFSIVILKNILVLDSRSQH